MSIERFFWKGIDSLAFYDQRRFAKYLDAEFLVHATIDNTTVRVPATLQSLVDALPADADRTNGREFFHLLFETDAGQETIAAGVYVIEHRDLGVFRLFLSPRREDLYQAVVDDDPIVVSTNTNLYRAIVSRLAYSAMGSQQAQTIDWPVHASRFNYESGFGPTAFPLVTGEYIIEGEGIEQ